MDVLVLLMGGVIFLTSLVGYFVIFFLYCLRVV
jgi:hypothetical protein